jgi:hypothetical protein
MESSNQLFNHAPVSHKCYGQRNRVDTWDTHLASNKIHSNTLHQIYYRLRSSHKSKLYQCILTFQAKKQKGVSSYSSKSREDTRQVIEDLKLLASY